MEEEFQSFFNELGPYATAGYKFFNAFKVKDTKILFYKDFEAIVDDEVLKDLRLYIKDEKKRLTDLKKTVPIQSVRQRVIFFITKLHELNVFTLSDRKYIFFFWQTLDDLLV
jgi:hypothetical protein